MRNERVMDFIRSELVRNDGVEPIGDSSDLLESGIIDSLGIMKLIAFLEQAFEIQILDLDLIPENFETVEAITNMIIRKRSTPSDDKRTCRSL